MINLTHDLTVMPYHSNFIGTTRISTGPINFIVIYKIWLFDISSITVRMVYYHYKTAQYLQIIGMKKMIVYESLLMNGSIFLQFIIRRICPCSRFAFWTVLESVMCDSPRSKVSTNYLFFHDHNYSSYTLYTNSF